MNGQINIGELKPFNYFIGIAVVVGLMFAFVSPDSELVYGWMGHILHWQIQTITPMLFALAAMLIIGKISYLNTFNPWMKLFLSGLCACLLTTPLAFLSDIALTNEQLQSSILVGVLNEFIGLSPPILVCWLTINAPFQFGWQLQRTEVASEPKDTKIDKTPNFFNLLPIELHGEIVYLKSELQYLKVVTVKGNALILYSLKSAIQDLSNTDGVQPHRSFWVNSVHVTKLNKLGRQGTIQLSNDDVIPVSRSKLQEVMTKLAT